MLDVVIHKQLIWQH